MALVQLKEGSQLRAVHYPSTATSTSTTPDPTEMAEVYELQRRELGSAQAIDWEAESAVWGEETRTWVEEVQQAGDEALLGDLPSDE
jgi:hypothetical protein